VSVLELKVNEAGRVVFEDDVDGMRVCCLCRRCLMNRYFLAGDRMCRYCRGVL